MSHITDRMQLGYFPLQDHSAKKNQVSVSARASLGGVRIVDVPQPDDEDQYVQFGRDNNLGTLGDIHPWMFWQVRDRQSRGMGSWAQSFAGLTGGPATGAGPVSNPDVVGVRPIADGAWTEDLRFDAKEVGPPAGLSKFPRGHMAIALPAMDEDQQFDLVGSLDTRLYAPHTNGPGNVGTLVVDLQPDLEPCMNGEPIPGQGGRHARLQSLVKVIPLNGNSGTESEYNGLAINYSQGRVDGVPGFGMIWTRMASAAAGPITGGPITGPVTGGTTGGGAPSGPITGVPSGSSAVLLDDIPTQSGELGLLPVLNGEQGLTPGDYGQFVETRDAAHGVALMAAQVMYGPIHGGHAEDKHRHGFDRDGNPVNSAHIASRAYFYRNQREDGPLAFEGDYPYPPSNKLQTQVHLTWDNDSGHPFRDGARSGIWRWYAEVPFLTPGGGKIPQSLAPPPTGGGDGKIPQSWQPRPPGGGGGGRGGPQPGGRGSSPPGGGRGPTTGGPATPGGGTPLPGSGGPITGGRTGPPVVPSGPAPFRPMPRRDYAPPGLFDDDEKDDPEKKKKGRASKHNWNRGGPPQSYAPGITGSKDCVGKTTSADRANYSILHPFQEAFSAVAFRPQLWVYGEPNFEHGGELDSDLIQSEDWNRPQVMVARAWGAQNLRDWDYTLYPEQSRARGGTADGGVLLSPPEFEMEDYFGIPQTMEDVETPATTSYFTAAPGVAFALGLPNADGGLQAGGGTIAKVADAIVLSQLDSSRVSQSLMSAEVDQSTGARVVTFNGTDAVVIPSGTTAQRPTAVRGMLRVNTSGSADVVEFYDAASAAWTDVSASGTVDGGSVAIASDTWSGSLVGSGITNAQELANWIDANFTP